MGKSKVNLYAIPKTTNRNLWIEASLKLLGLEGMKASWENIAEKIIQEKLTPFDFLESLLEIELGYKEDSRLTRWKQKAHFPFIKSLKDFDFSYQPSIDQIKINMLATCRFIERHENVVFFGPPGVGKTHLAVALAMEAIKNGKEPLFWYVKDLIDTIEKINDSLTARRLFSSLLRPDLLILDEMDFYEANSSVSTFLFKLLHQRYEKGSTIFTSNKPFTEWSKLFGNQARAGAIIDRITHHRTIININGESYRLKRDKIDTL